MKTHPQNNDDMRRLAECLEGQRSAMLSYGDAQGQIHAKPMTPLEMDEQGDIWMMVSRKSAWPAWVAEHLQVNLSFVDLDEALHVSVSGIARLSDDMTRKQALWTAMARPWFSGGVEDPDLMLLAVRPHLADVWEGQDNAAVRLMAMAASVMAAKPIGMGERTTIDTTRSAAQQR